MSLGNFYFALNLHFLLMLCFESLWSKSTEISIISSHFSPANGALREGADAWQLEVGERLADVALRHAELDPALLEPLGERLQLPGEHIVTASAVRRDTSNSTVPYHVDDAHHGWVGRWGVTVYVSGHA